MKALVLNTIGGGFDLEDIDISSPTGREVLVDVQASGLCHTDLLFATHDIAPIPSVLGHEVAGIVAEVGTDVAEFRVGDHVVGSSRADLWRVRQMSFGPPFSVRSSRVDAPPAGGCAARESQRGWLVPGFRIGRLC
jgi:S-(hydroxymethyl)glutathione dehydrogenase / alcohol dehydrogenase